MSKTERVTSRHDSHDKAWLFKYAESKHGPAVELEQSGTDEQDARSRAWQWRHEEPASVTEVKGK